MTVRRCKKDPGAKLDYDLTLGAGFENDTIASVTWIVPDGVVDEGQETPSTHTARIWISGGTLGVEYPITGRITTTGGRILDRTISLQIAENVKIVTKDPDSTEDYTIKWGRWLASKSDLIDVATWTAGTGITVADSSYTNKTSTVWLSGGSADSVVDARGRIETVGGRINYATIRVQLRSQ